MERVNQIIPSIKSFLLSYEQRGNEAIETLISFLRGKECEDALRYVQESLPHLKSSVTYANEKVKESLPHLKSSVVFAKEKVKESLPLVKSSADFAKEKVKDYLPFVKEFVGFVLEKLDQYTPDFLKRILFYSVEKAKEHPYLFGCLVLIVWLTSRSGGGGGGGKMMKAPGRAYRILRAGFEENPRSYFRDLRGK